MENQIIVPEKNTLTAPEIRAQVNLIQSVMQEVMKNGTHYGKVPGCGDKPTLLKPGAEKIMATFMLSADPIIDDLSTSDVIRYRLTVKMLTRDGKFLGAGVGEASSEEEKYNWRKAVCPEEFEATPEDRRREKWAKGWQGASASKVQQVRTNKADIANTILKMAKKRALVDGVLTVTAASDIFAQDLEDMPEEIINQNGPAVNGKPPVDMPQAKAAPATAPEAPKDVLNVIQALAQPIGATFDVWGILFDFKSIVTKTKKDMTYYKLSPREGTEVIEIAKFGKPHDGIANSDVLKFLGVKVTEYNKEKKYLAENIEVLEANEQ